MTRPFTLNLREKREIGHVINASFSFLRYSYFKMFADLLLFSTPLFAIGGLLSASNQYISISQSGLGSLYVYTQPEFYYSLIFSYLGYAMCFTIVTNYVLQYSQTGSWQFDRREIMENVKNEFLKMVLATFIYWLVTLVGLILLIVPGMYYSISYSLARTIMVLEKKSIGESFRESSRLVAGNWWRTLGLFYLASFLIGIIGFLFVIPMVILTFIIKFNSLQNMDVQGYHLSFVISSVIANVGAGLLYPLVIVALAIYTFSRKEEKDQSSLIESIESIGTQTAPKKEDEGTY